MVFCRPRQWEGQEKRKTKTKKKEEEEEGYSVVVVQLLVKMMKTMSPLVAPPPITPTPIYILYKDRQIVSTPVLSPEGQGLYPGEHDAVHAVF